MVLFWIVYGLIILIHLWFCFKELHKYRKITKVLLMPMLILYLLLIKANNALIYLALMFGFFGDLFLINSNNPKYFICGCISFFIGHIFYIIEITKSLPFTINLIHYLLFLVVIIIYLTLSFIFTRKILKNLTLICVGYSFILFLALFLSLLTKNYLVSLGYFIFIISDSVLIFSKKIKKIKREHLYIMSTYITAQILIVIGLT